MYQHTAESQQVPFQKAQCVESADEDPGPITLVLASLLGLFILIATTITFASHQVHASATPDTTLSSPFSNTQIARAALATVSGQMPADISVIRQENGVVYTSGNDDHSGWNSRCKVIGDRIVLATATGRWKTDLQNEKLTFAIEGDALAVTCLRSNGSLTKMNFTLEELTI